MISKEEIQDIALLSKLSVNENELPALTEDMKKIIEFADTINNASVETSDFDGISGLENVYRSDTVVESYPAEKILENALGGENGFFPALKK